MADDTTVKQVCSGLRPRFTALRNNLYALATENVPLGRQISVPLLDPLSQMFARQPNWSPLQTSAVLALMSILSSRLPLKPHILPLPVFQLIAPQGQIPEPLPEDLDGSPDKVGIENMIGDSVTLGTVQADTTLYAFTSNQRVITLYDVVDGDVQLEEDTCRRVSHEGFTSS